MRKLALILAVILAAGFTALAEDIDLSSLSLEELVALDSRVHEEIYARDSMNQRVYYAGTYYVGEGLDIEPGAYVVQPVESFNEYGVVSLHLYEPNPDYDADTDDEEDAYIYIDTKDYYTGDRFQVSLEDGGMVMVSRGIVLLIKR